MKNEKEIVGTLSGFDSFVNMVLEDVVEYETTGEGRRVTKLDTILLNGNHIAMLVPGMLLIAFQKFTRCFQVAKVQKSNLFTLVVFL